MPILPRTNAGEENHQSTTWADRPDLIINDGDLPATARELCELFARCGYLFDRGVPVKVVRSPDAGPPVASRLTTERVVVEAHRLCRPVKQAGDGMAQTTLPNRVARMYLAMAGEWNLTPLAGICTSPLLSSDGSVRTAQGYDRATGLWCADLPELRLPEHPTRTDAEIALRFLRQNFRTFPFSDAARGMDPKLGVDSVTAEQPPGMDESAFLVGLFTAICRQSLGLAPGLLVRGPEISGAGTGKGLLVRSICAIAYGVRPRAFTRGDDRRELDKRLAADLIEASPIVFLDNVNSTMLRSDILASVLTEWPARVRVLGQSQMVTLNSAAFIAVTGNGVTISEDLARRFVICELDARCEDPEQRAFEGGFLKEIEQRRAELLSAALTVWRWGRQAAEDLKPGRSLGSFEGWSAWCRDPLLALGCRDPIERIGLVKADDPLRGRIVEIFHTWSANHGERPVKAADLAKPVQDLVDPHGRGRQFSAWYLIRLTGTRAGGFVLTRQEAAGKWGAATYALRRTGSPNA